MSIGPSSATPRPFRRNSGLRRRVGVAAWADRGSDDRRWGHTAGTIPWVLGGVVLVGVLIVAWSRVGFLNLPSAPAGVGIQATGLSGLAELKQFNAELWSGKPSEFRFVGDTEASSPHSSAARMAQQGIAKVQHGEMELGLEDLRSALRVAPRNLVLGNAYRMIAFRLRRDHLRASRRAGSFSAEFPPTLEGQPIAFLEELAQSHPSRETHLQLALAWVDQMLLFPALEIKAPSSVEAVKILNAILEAEPYYVPARYARGLNHLHRPARLVWPETDKVPLDAAVQDIGLCISIGRRVEAGSNRLKATMAIALGDAYVKAGKMGQARSWWQIAQNLGPDGRMESAIRRRFSWEDDRVLDQLEAELDRARAELDNPMTDLAFMWD